MAGDVKWHINPETGKPGRCAAVYQCRFGASEEEHYSNREDAQEAYERSQGSSFGEPLKPSGPPPEVEDFTRKFPGHVALSNYVNEGDYIVYRDEVIKVKSFQYERALLSYIVEGADGQETFIPDDDWYHDSKIYLLPRKEEYDVEDFDKEAYASNLKVGQPFTTEDSNEIYHFLKYDDMSNKVYVEEFGTDSSLEDHLGLRPWNDEHLGPVLAREKDFEDSK